MESSKNTAKIWSEVLNSVSPKFDELKPLLDKYPNAFSIKYSKERGYLLIVREDAILNP